MDPSGPVFRIPTVVGPATPICVARHRHVQATLGRWDIHLGLELGVVLGGRLTRLWRGVAVDLQPGQAWLCDAMEAHGFAADQPCELAVILLWPGTLAQPVGEVDLLSLFRCRPADRPNPTSAEACQRVAAMAEAVLAVGDGRPYAATERVIRTQLLLLELARHRREETLRSADRREGAERILPALTLVESAVDESVTIARAAGACHLSRTLFTAVFRSAMGTPFAEYVRRRRLAGVATELRTGRTKLATLAERYGFVDAAHLTKVFKQQFGMTPREYRSGVGKE
jgi:AraC family transcriptional regulator